MIRVLLLTGYCVPFAFLSVYGDASFGTMLFYGLMIAGFALLCWSALRTNNVVLIFAGNLLSFLSSHMAAKLAGMEPMGHYFKPFTARTLILAISAVGMFIHAAIVCIYMARKKK